MVNNAEVAEQQKQKKNSLPFKICILFFLVMMRVYRFKREVAEDGITVDSCGVPTPTRSSAGLY